MDKQTTGRFELSEAIFKKRKDESKEQFQALDLKSLFPKLFVGDKKMPQRLGQIWRNVVDTYLDNEKGYYYFHEKNGLIHFTFDSAQGALAKAKIDHIGKSIQEALNESISSGDSLHEVSDNKPKPADKKASGDENLKKVLEGLRENPSISEVKLWSSRTLQNLHLSKSTPQDILKLQEEYKICYVPLWNAKNNVLVGASCELNPYGTSATNEGQLIRDNIAQISWARQEVGRLLEKNAQAIVVVPIYIKSLIEKDVIDLIITLLKKAPEPIRKSMIFELRGMGQNQIPAVAKAPLQTISQICRALIIDTGILTQPDMEKEPFKIHAYGFSYNDVNLPPEQRLNLMKKYATTYKSRNTNTYIRNVPNILTMEKAQEFGFTYINAPSVLNPKLSCPAASHMSLKNIKGS